MLHHVMDVTNIMTKGTLALADYHTEEALKTVLVADFAFPEQLQD